jgi:hypothetical protein
MKNEALARLEPLVGSWDVTLTNAWFLDSLDVRMSGWATFEWIDEAFIIWRWNTVDGEPSEFVFGHSDARERYVVLYHDARGVSRAFDMTWGDGTWTLLREDPDFHQRLVATVQPDRIVMQVDASEDAGHTWRRDFDLVFERKGTDGG